MEVFGIYVSIINLKDNLSKPFNLGEGPSGYMKSMKLTNRIQCD